MEAVFKKFKELFAVKDKDIEAPTTSPVYVYYAEIDLAEWVKQGKPSVKEFLNTYGALGLYGPDQERPSGCVGVEKGWKIVFRLDNQR